MTFRAERFQGTESYEDITGAHAENGVTGPQLGLVEHLVADEAAGVAPEDLELVELHDCFATAELRHYDNLRLCPEGGAGEWIDRRGLWRGGEIPVSVCGGLLSKGHPSGGTGIGNIYEETTRLRGEAGDRQIEGARVGLTHAIGLGSACAVHIVEKAAA